MKGSGRFPSFLPSLQELRGSDFVQKVGETFATRVITFVLGFAVSVWVARILGPAGRGEFILAGTLAALAMQLGNLGLHSANVYAVSKHPASLPRLIANSLWVSLAVGAVTAVTLGAASWRGASWVPVHGTLLVLAMIAVPAGLTVLFLQYLLLGLQKVRDYNRSELWQKILAVALIGLLLATGRVTPVWVFSANIAATLLIIPWMLGWFPSSRAPALRPDPGLFRANVTYGFKVYLAALFSFLIMRVDFFLLPATVGQAGVGQYSVAFSLIEAMSQLPVVVGMIFFPKMASLQDEATRWRQTKRVGVLLALTMAVLCLAAYALSSWGIVLLYGEPYAAAVPAFQVLLLALWLLSVNTVLMNYFASIGMPSIAVWSPLAAAAVNIALNWVWIPPWGLAGAAWAKVVGYGMMGLVSAVYLAARGRKTHAR
jgi:O-antigen/teichoic acid export membrane protein